MHSFVVSTADDCAQNLVLARRGGRSEIEFLHARLQFKVPAGPFGAVFGTEQAESVNRAVPVPAFAFMRVDTQQKRFAGLHGDLGFSLANYFEATGLPGHDFNYARLAESRCANRQEEYTYRPHYCRGE